MRGTNRDLSSIHLVFLPCVALMLNAAITPRIWSRDRF
jgi:hypothetical protein